MLSMADELGLNILVSHLLATFRHFVITVAVVDILLSNVQLMFTFIAL
ncbi:hypothetical protein SPWS13_2673 [Shewanella putrefaciens]|nr:hypothetical protein SPWS13_2673 [Shewanella putrefaciens]